MKTFLVIFTALFVCLCQAEANAKKVVSVLEEDTLYLNIGEIPYYCELSNRYKVINLFGLSKWMLGKKTKHPHSLKIDDQSLFSFSIERVDSSPSDSQLVTETVERVLQLKPGGPIELVVNFRVDDQNGNTKEVGQGFCRQTMEME